MSNQHPLVARRPLALPRTGPNGPHPLAAVTRRSAAPSSTPPATPARLPVGPVASRTSKSWLRRNRWSAAAVGAMVIVAAGVTAALLIRQDITTNPAAVAPDVRFETGTDYTTINAAGFATLTIGSSGASATLALSGVAGAALTGLTNVAQIHNTDATQDYTVTFARSATPNAAITDFTVTVKNGGTTVLTWNAVTTATSSSFSLPASADYDISIQLAVVDGTAAGALGSFTMQASLVPA